MKYFWLLLALVLTCVIFINSSLPASESARISGWAAQVIDKFCAVLGIYLSGDTEYLLRKLAHFLEFAFLGLLWCKTFAGFHVSNRAATGYILFLCLFTAAVDEYIQLFSLGRSSLVRDVLLDFSGAFCAWLWYRIWQWCD